MYNVNCVLQPPCFTSVCHQWPQFMKPMELFTLKLAFCFKTTCHLQIQCMASIQPFTLTVTSDNHLSFTTKITAIKRMVAKDGFHCTFVYSGICVVFCDHLLFVNQTFSLSHLLSGYEPKKQTIVVKYRFHGYFFTTSKMD